MKNNLELCSFEHGDLEDNLSRPRQMVCKGIAFCFENFLPQALYLIVRPFLRMFVFALLMVGCVLFGVWVGLGKYQVAALLLLCMASLLGLIFYLIYKRPGNLLAELADWLFQGAIRGFMQRSVILRKHSVKSRRVGFFVLLVTVIVALVLCYSAWKIISILPDSISEVVKASVMPLEVVIKRLVLATLVASGYIVASLQIIYLFFYLIKDIWLGKKATKVNEGQVRAFRKSSGLEITHLSDLHFVGHETAWRLETGVVKGSSGLQGNGTVSNLLDRAFKGTAKVLIVSGDITDCGGRTEFLAFSNALRRYSDDDPKKCLIIAPGNHDLNIIDSRNPSRIATPIPFAAFRLIRLIRYIRYFELLRQHMHLDSCFIVAGDGQLNGTSLKEYISSVSSDIDAYQNDTLGLFGQIKLSRKLRGAFPLYVEIDSEWGALVVNSCWPTATSASNAFGWVDIQQLNKLRLLLRANPNRRFMLVLHHQIVDFEGVASRWRDDAATILINRDELMRALSEAKNGIVVFHGHRHIDAVGEVGNMLVISAPSAALPCEGSNISDRNGTAELPGFRTHRIEARNGKIVWVGSTPELHVVA